MKLIFFCIFSTLFISANTTAKSIYIVYPEAHTSYKNLSDATRTLITHQHIDNIYVQSIDEFKQSNPHNESDLIVSIGIEPKNIESTSGSMILYSLIPDQILPSNNHYKNSQWNVILANQPITEFLSLAKKLITTTYKKKIIIIISEKNPNIEKYQQKIDQNRDVEIKIITIPEGSVAAKIIEKDLFDAAALIAIQDDMVWSKKNATWILRQAYEYKTPVIGYSQSFLKAGAMVSIYSSAEQISNSMASEINYWIKNNKLSEKKPIYPEFTIKTNKNIARALKFDNKTIEKIEGK